MKFSVSEENYIKGIYHHQQLTGSVNTNTLAQHLQTKAASVTDMLKKLSEKKLLHYERYRGFRLSEKGNKVALDIVRRHRLWEFFLVAKLGFDWDKVHDIAEDLEHVSSKELIQRLETYLGNPTTDPHGDPIPDSEGRLPFIRQLNLTELPLHKLFTISAVTDQTPQMMELLKHFSINIGTRLKINKRFAFDGSLEIIVNKQTCTISGRVASNIFVHHDSE